MDFRFDMNIRTDNKDDIVNNLKLLIDYLNIMEESQGEIKPFEIRLYSSKPGDIVGQSTLVDADKWKK